MISTSCALIPITSQWPFHLPLFLSLGYSLRYSGHPLRRNFATQNRATEVLLLLRASEDRFVIDCKLRCLIPSVRKSQKEGKIIYLNFGETRVQVSVPFRDHFSELRSRQPLRGTLAEHQSNPNHYEYINDTRLM